MVMFPKVPNVLGVPKVARNALNSLRGGVPSVVGIIGSLTGEFDFLDQDGPGISSLTGQPRWGLFDEGGSPVINPDTFIGVEVLKEYQTSNYPIEEGGFESYNKVETPFSGKVTYAKGGSEDERAQFITEVIAAVKSLDLYTLVTPEVSYSNVNVVHYDYRRTTTNGATMLTVEVWLEEIRNTVSAAFSNTQQPAGADVVNNGGVQPQTPTPTQSTASRALAEAIQFERTLN